MSNFDQGQSLFIERAALPCFRHRLGLCLLVSKLPSAPFQSTDPFFRTPLSQQINGNCNVNSFLAVSELSSIIYYLSSIKELGPKALRSASFAHHRRRCYHRQRYSPLLGRGWGRLRGCPPRYPQQFRHPCWSHASPPCPCGRSR